MKGINRTEDHHMLTSSISPYMALSQPVLPLLSIVFELPHCRHHTGLLKERLGLKSKPVGSGQRTLQRQINHLGVFNVHPYISFTV